MSVPPPPPPPGPPPPPLFTPPPKSQARSQLLQSIEGFSKTKLQKTKTVDKSVPLRPATSSSVPSSDNHSGSTASSNPVAGLGGLFAGGMPRLRSTGLKGASTMVSKDPPSEAKRENCVQSSATHKPINNSIKMPSRPSPPSIEAFKPIIVNHQQQQSTVHITNLEPVLQAHKELPSILQHTNNELKSQPRPPPPTTAFVPFDQGNPPPYSPPSIAQSPIPPKPLPSVPNYQMNSNMTSIPPIKSEILRTKPLPKPKLTSNQPSVPDNQTQPIQVPVCAIGISPFQAIQANDISFDVDEIITHIAKNPNHWWEGNCRRKRGSFPANYVKELQPIENVYVKFPFQATNPDEIDLISRNEMIVVLHKFSSGWWFGSGVGKLGLFPYNYVTNTPSTSNQENLNSPVKNIVYHDHSQGEHRPNQPEQLKTQEEKRAKVVFKFVAQHPSDLSLEVGEIIRVLSSNGNWWKGVTSDGRQGTFPFNYVQLLLNDE